MKIYIPKIPEHAGHWIFKGFKSAWGKIGYDTVYYSRPEDININDDYYIMINDTWIGTDPRYLLSVEKSSKAFVQAQPNTFPLPWGGHPNFVSLASDDIINKLNNMQHALLWGFGDDHPYHTKWKKIHAVPLAFDSVNYKLIDDERFVFDVCFIGGWANNGFDEKRKIMLKYLGAFKETSLKCGFFVGRDIPHSEENLILSNSKVAINIHDAYQQKLGLDTNERTFKSLGLTGVLVSDNIGQIKNIFPRVPLADSPEEMVNLVKEHINMPAEELQDLRNKNRQEVLENHTYKTRVQEFLSL